MVIIGYIKKKKLAFCLGSILIGYYIGTVMIDSCNHSLFPRFTSDSEFTSYKGLVNVSFVKHFKPGIASNIYVGMMSAKKYLLPRVQEAVWAWLSKGDWKVEVFADPGQVSIITPQGFDFSIVNIHAVDDTAYPPQQKSFSLLRHMFDYYIDDYDWFMRVDDDLLLHSHRLHKLLARMNSSRPIYFGSPGFGIDADDGIEEGMYFLMGGPGIIMSRGLLIEFRKHMGYCIKHLFSPHEDVELGRCVWKYVKDAVIPVAWEVVDLFKQQYDKKTGDTINIIIKELSEVQVSKPVTYHSLKDAGLMHQLHCHLLKDKMAKLVQRSSRLREEVASMKTILDIDKVTSLKPKSRHSNHLLMTSYRRDVTNDDEEKAGWPSSSEWRPATADANQYESFIPWVYWDKYYRFQPSRDVPTRGHSSHERSEYNTLLEKMDSDYIKQACPGFSSEHRFERSYYQLNPNRGVHFITVHKAFDKGEEKYCVMKLSRVFGCELMSEHTTGYSTQDASDLYEEEGSPLHRYVTTHRRKLIRFNLPDSPPPQVDKIVFIVPLSGRYQALEKFLEGYKQNFLVPIRDGKVGNLLESNVQLVVVLFGQPDGGEDSVSIQRANAQLLKSYQQEFGSELVQYYHVNYGVKKFSRGAGLQFGALIAGERDIIFFIDVDMLVTSQLASQCRRNTLRGRRAWFPVPYSQYDPKRRCNDFGGAEVEAEGDFAIGEEVGFWRSYGLGITCMYKRDFAQASGFDLTIQGWGEEDVRLFVAILRSRDVDAFRSNEQHLVHIYHDKLCSSQLEGEQARACRGTKVSHYSSQRCLAATYDKQHSP